MPRTVPTSVPRHCANTVCIARQTVPRTVPRIVPRTVYCAKNCAKNGLLYQELCQEMCPYCANNCAKNYCVNCAKKCAKMLAQSHKKGHAGEIFNGETLKKPIYWVFYLTVLDWLNGARSDRDGPGDASEESRNQVPSVGGIFQIGGAKP